jgi:endonuclease/exonuclease/phosphatase family metal-dependent hydrolase
VRGRFNIFVIAVLLAVLAGPVVWVAATQSDAPALAPLPASGQVLLVASLNLAMSTSPATIAAEIGRLPALRDADVLLLQEVVRTPKDEPSIAEQLALRLGRVATFVSPDGTTTRMGLAILTRTALRDVRQHALKPQNLIFRSRKRCALAGTVDSVVGPVRVINLHLDTRINPGERLNQLAPVLEDAQAFRGPAVIGGDFNTNDMQWVSNVVPVLFPGWQASRVRALMQSRGFQTPFVTRRATFDHLGMQLDWIYTNRLKASGSGIQPIDFSDHHAVWAQLTR